MDLAKLLQYQEKIILFIICRFTVVSKGDASWLCLVKDRLEHSRKQRFSSSEDTLARSDDSEVGTDNNGQVKHPLGYFNAQTSYSSTH